MPVNNLLFEIGTEELPPKSLNRLRETFADNCRKALTEAGLEFESIQSYATPRRLAIHVSALADRQPDQRVERRGPAVKAAFDDTGEPTKALQGFMRSCGISEPDQLERMETEKGEWLVYRATNPGAPLGELLAEIINSALVDLPIDRRMRWGKLRSEFVRPVKWTVCLYGSEVLPIEVLGFTADRSSMGHRFMSEGAVTINSADDYVEAMRQAKVVVDFAERRQSISEQIEHLADSNNGALENDNALLDEVTALVEWPVALLGQFEERFLDVPQEVLISAMKEHQRYFHLVEPATGKLLPAFITVSNIESTSPETVVSGNERVIRPRLADAAFFFEQDAKQKLIDRVERLESVVFQTELGTYRQKAERISKLAAAIAEHVGADGETAGRAGLLAKTDLVTDMVGEFPDLQGVMGGYYARKDGETNDVAEGIAQHYRPSQAGGALPSGPVASSVALADKLDTIVGLFGINQPPTGSRDPFALRRQSLGVIRICVENSLDLDLSWCLETAARIYDRNFETDPALSYITERLGGYYQDQGISSDIVDAVISAEGSGNDSRNLNNLDEVIQAIHAFRKEEVAEQVIAANKRIANILKKNAGDALPEEFDESLIADDAERALADAVKTFTVADGANATVLLHNLATLQAPVDHFFDEVLVMADDEKVRRNRLVLLAKLRALFLDVADFSLLQ